MCIYRAWKYLILETETMHKYVSLVLGFCFSFQNYAITLAKQLGKKSAYATLGVPLKDNQLELMSDEQISQLFDLFQEIQGPTVPKTDSIDINIKADEGIPKSWRMENTELAFSFNAT